MCARVYCARRYNIFYYYYTRTVWEPEEMIIATLDSSSLDRLQAIELHIALWHCVAHLTDRISAKAQCVNVVDARTAENRERVSAIMTIHP